MLDLMSEGVCKLSNAIHAVFDSSCHKRHETIKNKREKGNSTISFHFHVNKILLLYQIVVNI